MLAKDEARRQLAAALLQVQSGGGVSVQFAQEKQDQAVKSSQEEHAARMGVERQLRTVVAEKLELAAKLSREQELRTQTLERLNNVSSTAKKKEAHLLRQLQLASVTSVAKSTLVPHEAVARKSGGLAAKQRNAGSVNATVPSTPRIGASASEINSDLQAWLKQAALVDYSTSLVNAGYDEITTIASLTDNELREVASLLHMPPGHRKKLQLGVAILRNSRQSRVPAEPFCRTPAHTSVESKSLAEAPLQRAKRVHGQAWNRLSAAEKQAALSATLDTRADAAIREAQQKLLEKETKLKQEEASLRKAKLRQDALRESEMAKIDKLKKQLEAQLRSTASVPEAAMMRAAHVNPGRSNDRSRQEGVKMVSALLRSVDSDDLDVQVEDVVRYFDSVQMPPRRWVPALQSKQRAGELGIFLKSLTAPAKLEEPRSAHPGATQKADTDSDGLDDGGDSENLASLPAQPANALESKTGFNPQTPLKRQDSDPAPESTAGAVSQAPEPAADEPVTPKQADEMRTPSRLVPSPFQSLRTRSRVKQQVAGGVLAATLLAGQQLFDVKQSHILRPGVPRNVVMTIGSQAVTLVQSVKTMKPLESYPLHQIKMSFRHDEASFTFRLRNQVRPCFCLRCNDFQALSYMCLNLLMQGGRELVFSSEKTVQIEVEIRSRLDEHFTIAQESVSTWLEKQGISDPQMIQASIRVLKKKTRESSSWHGMLQQMNNADAAYFIQQAKSLAHMQNCSPTSSEDEPASSDGEDNAADTLTAQQRLFNFRDRLPQNLVEAKSLAVKAKESIIANMAGDETDSGSDDDNPGPDETAHSFDPAGLSDGMPPRGLCLSDSRCCARLLTTVGCARLRSHGIHGKRKRRWYCERGQRSRR